MLEDRVKADVKKLVQEDKVIQFSLTKDLHVIHIQYFNQLKDEIIEELKTFHEEYPLKSGMPKEEIRSKYLKKC